MPATVSTRGVLKASTNRVRTSTALQGSAMWENVIGIVNEERGTNAGVEALINAPQRGGGNHNAKKEARRAAAAEAVLATGGFDTAITSYNELLSLAKSQGAMGEGATRGACKVCGQLGHLTKQCRNQFSKFYQNDAGPSTAAGAAANAAIPSADGGRPALSGDSLGSLGRDSDKLSSDSSSGSSSSDSDSEEERRRRKKKKEKKRKRERERKEKKRRHKERDHGGRSSSGKDKKHKKSKRHRSRSRSPKRERRD